VRLVLDSAELPKVRLKPHGPRLGWTSWLEKLPSRSEKRPDSEVMLSLNAWQSEINAVRSYVFSGLPRGKQAELFKLMTAKVYPEQTVVMSQGAAAGCVYFIRRGKVQLLRRERDGKETVLGTLDEGDFFGERAVLSGKVSGLTALTVTECEIYTLPSEQFEAFIERYPNLRRVRDAYVLKT
jgi:CRP-like cAMP-binding protein